MRIRAWVQVVLDETARIVRDDRVLNRETHQGFVCATPGSTGPTWTAAE